MWVLTKYLGLNEKNVVVGYCCSAKNNFFESLQLHYFGPVNGHDLTALIDTLTLLKNTDGPKLLHIRTIKGKGYVPAEQNQTQWHAPGLFDKISGQILKKKADSPQPPKYQDVWTLS